MSDEATKTTGAEQSDGTGTVLDLRPAKDSLVYQLLRLGLSFDHKDDGGETWTDYTRGVTASFSGRDAKEVTLADMDTKDSRTVSLADLENVTEIKTWRSDGAHD